MRPWQMLCSPVSVCSQIGHPSGRLRFHVSWQFCRRVIGILSDGSAKPKRKPKTGRYGMLCHLDGACHFHSHLQSLVQDRNLVPEYAPAPHTLNPHDLELLPSRISCNARQRPIVTKDLSDQNPSVLILVCNAFRILPLAPF